MFDSAVAGCGGEPQHADTVGVRRPTTKLLLPPLVALLSAIAAQPAHAQLTHPATPAAPTVTATAAGEISLAWPERTGADYYKVFVYRESSTWWQRHLVCTRGPRTSGEPMYDCDTFDASQPNAAKWVLEDLDPGHEYAVRISWVRAKDMRESRRSEATYATAGPPQCADGVSNDGDAPADMADPDCSSSEDNNETGLQFRGAAVHPMWDSDDDGLRDFATLAATGANVARVDISWAGIERDAKGDFESGYIGQLDRMMANARSNGLQLIATLMGTPCWASTDPGKDCSEPYDETTMAHAPEVAGDYGAVVAWVLDRYGPTTDSPQTPSSLAALEVFNEPNEEARRAFKVVGATADTGPDADIERNRELLTSAYKPLVRHAHAAKARVGSEVPILAGALATADVEWLDALLADEPGNPGIGGHYDGLSFHPYNETRDPLAGRDPWLDQWTYRDAIPYMRRSLRQRGQGDKPIWITETGFSSCARGAGWSCVGLADQADYVSKLFEVQRDDDWSTVKAITVYNLRDKDSGSVTEDSFGLLSRDFTEKPAMSSFRAAMSE